MGLQEPMCQQWLSLAVGVALNTNTNRQDDACRMWSSLSENMGAIRNESHVWCTKNSLRGRQSTDGLPVTNAHPCLHTSKHLCTAGLYAAHDPYLIRTLSLPCVKLSPTCHAALGRCGEA